MIACRPNVVNASHRRDFLHDAIDAYLGVIDCATSFEEMNLETLQKVFGAMIMQIMFTHGVVIDRVQFKQYHDYDSMRQRMLQLQNNPTPIKVRMLISCPSMKD